MLIGCHDCGAVQRTRPLPRRGRLECWQCGNVLEHRTGRSIDAGLACGLATLALLFPANFLTLMTVHVAGISDSTHLASGLGVSWRQGWYVVTAILGLQGILLPFFRFGLLTLTLGAVRLGRQRAWTGPAFRLCQILDTWAMTDVLAIGFGVGYGRVASQIPVAIDTGGWCFLASAIMTLLTRAAIDRRSVWRHIAAPAQDPGPHPLICVACDLPLPAAASGGRCPRCRQRLWRRRPHAFMRTAALVIACWALIPMAYWLPMSEFWEAGTPHPHSILDGIALLFGHGFWPLGVLICVVSVGIPLGKLTGLTWFLLATRRHSGRHLRLKTRLYRIIDESGRWSNLDPFTVMIFAPMVQFGQLAHINVEVGSLYFLSMVVLSMIAARLFDPRLMWDAACSRAPAAPSAAPAVAG